MHDIYSDLQCTTMDEEEIICKDNIDYTINNTHNNDNNICDSAMQIEVATNNNKIIHSNSNDNKIFEYKRKGKPQKHERTRQRFHRWDKVGLV